METEEQYFHILPELRQLMLLGSKPPILHSAADHLNSMLTAAGACGPLPSQLTSPQLPPPPSFQPLFARNMNASSSVNNGGAVGDCGLCSLQGRWPRQETLTLLEIRAQLDPQFREAGQKAPLWDEVARIMAEEYGYQRSGRKCREKLDNLYKYYKKTKEGKVGKQEGKHYRFFRQLEALYGASATAGVVKSTTPANTHPRKRETAPIAAITNRTSLFEDLDGLGFSTSTESSGEGLGCEEEVEEAVAVERSSYRKMKSWKMIIAELADAQMKRLLEMQEAWFEKMLRCFERMEQERVRREESWRKEEAAWHEREQLLHASERALTEAREASLLKALEKITRQQDNMRPATAAPLEESEEMECDLSRAMGVL